MVPVRQQFTGSVDEFVSQVWDFLDDADAAQRCFLAHVAVLAVEQRGHLGGDVTRHLRGAYVPQGAQREARDEMVSVHKTRCRCQSNCAYVRELK